MGTAERGKLTGGSLVDGIKRRSRAAETREEHPERPAGAPPEPRRAREARRSSLDVLDELGERFGLEGDLEPLTPLDDETTPLRRLPFPLPRHLRRPEPVPGMLGFHFDRASGGWLAQPQRPFKPRGLYIVGALSTGDRLAQSYVGTNGCVLCSCDGVPAHFFATARSYEQIAKAVADGNELPAWGEWSVAHPGVNVWVRVTAGDGMPLGPDRIDLGMWGHALS